MVKLTAVIHFLNIWYQATVGGANDFSLIIGLLKFILQKRVSKVSLKFFFLNHSRIQQELF